MDINSILSNFPENNISIKDIPNFSLKLNNLIISYKSNPGNIIFITDFDYTITKRYNYQKNSTLFSSYRFYDESLIGGDQQKILDIQNQLCNEYMKYETDSTYDKKIREQKVHEFYSKSLDVYINPKFTRNSIGKMLEKFKEKYELRKYTKELFELLIKLEIPIVIVSGGVKEVIIDLLKTCINNFEKYLSEKKIIIIANELYFEEGKGCIGHSTNVIYAFNKSNFVKETIKNNFPQVTNVIVMGDHLNDFDSVQDLEIDKNDIIGIGFVNIKPEILNDETKKEIIKKNVEEYNNVYDVNLIGDNDFDFIIKLFEKFQQ
jgi:2-hydroxy-3-keto-5-methylthiopentenyl-1-phosphate phosphatase